MLIRTKAKLNHMSALYATPILCTEHVESCSALNKAMSSHFCFCDWLSIITLITFNIIEKNIYASSSLSDVKNELI